MATFPYEIPFYQLIKGSNYFFLHTKTSEKYCSFSQIEFISSQTTCLVNFVLLKSTDQFRGHGLVFLLKKQMTNGFVLQNNYILWLALVKLTK